MRLFATNRPGAVRRLTAVLLAAVLIASPGGAAGAAERGQVLYNTSFNLDSLYNAFFELFLEPDGKVFFSLEKEMASTNPLRDNPLHQFDKVRREFGLGNHYQDLADLLDKALEWGRVARSEKVDVEKEVGFLGKRELIVLFRSQAEGRHLWVILDVPFFRQAGYPRLRFYNDNIQNLRDALLRVPEESQKMRQAQELFD